MFIRRYPIWVSSVFFWSFRFFWRLRDCFSSSGDRVVNSVFWLVWGFWFFLSSFSFSCRYVVSSWLTVYCVFVDVPLV